MDTSLPLSPMATLIKAGWYWYNCSCDDYSEYFCPHVQEWCFFVQAVGSWKARLLAPCCFDRRAVLNTDKQTDWEPPSSLSCEEKTLKNHLKSLNLQLWLNLCTSKFIYSRIYQCKGTGLQECIVNIQIWATIFHAYMLFAMSAFVSRGSKLSLTRLCVFCQSYKVEPCLKFACLWVCNADPLFSDLSC